VLRHLALVFIVVMAAVLFAAVVWLLAGGLAESQRAGSAPPLRLTALDAMATPSPGRVRGAAVLEDVARGRRVRRVALYFRFDDGYVGAGWVNAEGVVACLRRGGQSEGRHPYEVFVSELSPEVGLCASATVWVVAPETAVLWVDAAAVAAPRQAARGGEQGRTAVGGRASAETPPDTLRALQTLASGRQLVYLVVADLGSYAEARERLTDGGVPAGPAVWIEPGTEQKSLGGLARTWPNIAGAVVCSEGLAEAVKAVGPEAFLVCPAAGAGAAPKGPVGSWDDVARRLGASGAGG